MKRELTKLIDAVSWGDYHHAYDSAEDFPQLFEQYLTLDDDDDEKWGTVQHINHQGTYYSVTAPAIAFFCKALPILENKPRSELLEFCICCCAENPAPDIPVLHGDQKYLIACQQALVDNAALLRPLLNEFPEQLIFAAAMLGIDWPEVAEIVERHELIGDLKYFYGVRQNDLPLDLDRRTRASLLLNAFCLLSQKDHSTAELEIIWDGIPANDPQTDVMAIGILHTHAEDDLYENLALKERVIRQRLCSKTDFETVSTMATLLGDKTNDTLNDLVGQRAARTSEFWALENRQTLEWMQKDYAWFPKRPENPDSKN